MNLHRLPKIKEVTGLSRSTIYKLMANGEFPQCVKLSARAVAWPSAAIDAWIKSRIEQSASR